MAMFWGCIPETNIQHLPLGHSLLLGPWAFQRELPSSSTSPPGPTHCWGPRPESVPYQHDQPVCKHVLTFLLHLFAALQVLQEIPYFATYNPHPLFWPKLSGRKNFVLIF